MKDHVRIVLVGDDGAGKTSLIATLLADSFQEQVDQVVPELTIPPSVTNDRVSTHIIDTSSRFQHKMDQQLRTADVVCLCYAADAENVTERIRYWLRHIRHTRQECHAPHVPVILVGNKIDTRGEDLTNPKLQEDMEPIMEEFKEVETCIECSAKDFLNVHEVFYFAQRAVLYPTSVLYDAASRSLRDECVDALKRIFKLCDRDRDGILSDDELNAFQARCFGASLDPTELQGVKDVVRGNVENGLTDRGLTLTGFLFLHHLFIQKGRLETTWTVLRQFGYDDHLRVDVQALCSSVPAPPAGHVYDLTPAGLSFFAGVYRAVDKGAGLVIDGTAEGSLADVFATVPDAALPAFWTSGELDFVTATQATAVGADPSGSSGRLSLRQWLALWSYTTVSDHRTTLEYLAWLGFEQEPQAGIALRPRREASTQLFLVVGEAALADAFLLDFLRHAGGATTSLSTGKQHELDSALLSTSTTTTTTSTTTTTAAKTAATMTASKRGRVVALGALPDVSGNEKYVALRRFGLDEAEAAAARLHEAALTVVLYDAAVTADAHQRRLADAAHVGAQLESAAGSRQRGPETAAPVLHLALHHTDGMALPDLNEGGLQLEAFTSFSTLLIKAHQLARRREQEGAAWGAWRAVLMPSWPQAALFGAVAVLVGGFLLYRHLKGASKQV